MKMTDIETISNNTTNPILSMLENQPDVMDINQMSSVLGISTKTGYAMLRNGEIAFLKIGRTYRIPKLKLLDYLGSATVH